MSRRALLALPALLSLLVLSACAGDPGHSEEAGHEEVPAGAPAHVHGVARDPRSGALLVAAHDGLRVSAGSGLERVGPVVDLMGFVVAGPDHYYASGHPGAGVDLPQPVGLVESRDGGATWRVLSRGGASDFHALAVTRDGVVGFDGTLKVSGDGRSWEAGDLDAEVRSLAGSPADRVVLATAPDGLRRSTDAGSSWAPVPGAPLLLVVARGDRGWAVGVTPQGAVHVSDDVGLTWRPTGQQVPGLEALGASGSGDALEVVAATDGRLVVSRGGAPFTAP